MRLTGSTQPNVELNKELKSLVVGGQQNEAKSVVAARQTTTDSVSISVGLTRNQRLDEIRSQIANGSYAINPEAIAASLLKKFSDAPSQPSVDEHAPGGRSWTA